MNVEVFDVIVPNLEFIKNYHDKINKNTLPDIDLKLTNDEAANMAIRCYCDYLRKLEGERVNNNGHWLL